MTGIKIGFGVMCDPVVSQLEEQGYTLDEKDAIRIQNLVHAINMVHLHGLVPESVCHTARKRLLKDILKCAKICQISR